MRLAIIFFLAFLVFQVFSFPDAECNYRGNLYKGQCFCFPAFSGFFCETLTLPPKENFQINPPSASPPPSYKNLGPKNCIQGVGCTYDVNWEVGYASTTYYGAGCTNERATTGKCGTACRKASKAQYTAAIPLAYWPPIRYGNCPSCGLDCLWEADVLLKGKPLCWKLTPYEASTSGLPTKQGIGKPIIVHVTDSCGGNCPEGPVLSKGNCNGANSPDCGNTALYEGAIQHASPPFKVYVGDHPEKPDPVSDGYRCIDAWECNLFGTKYWSPCYHGQYSVSAPGFLDWCAGNHMHIDINTESMQDDMIAFCDGVSFPGNPAGCMAKYERVDCGYLPEKPETFAQGYSHWDQVNQRNVYCCQKQSWGTFSSCEGTRGNLPLCASNSSGDCWQSVCK